MAQGHRPDRVGDQIREMLSEMLSRGAVHDPGIGFITITRVKVSADLQMARVFYTSLGDEKARRDTARALDRATPYFRRQVGGRLQLRRVPELEFRFDESIANQDRIEQILRDLEAERTATAEQAATGQAASGVAASEQAASEPGPSDSPDSTVPPHTHDHRD
jgi:ribosome-binding factor A